MTDGVFEGPWELPPDEAEAARMLHEKRVEYYADDLLAKEQAADKVREARGEGGALRSASLSRFLKEGVKPPRLMCDSMLYEGGLHVLSGGPDVGKSFMSFYWALQLLQEGERVLFLDEEGGPEITAEKFGALGATPSDMDFLTYVPFPGRTWHAGDILRLHDLACDVRAKMILWDSSAAFLARAGLDENSASDVTRFWGTVLTPLARDLQAAIMVIDHDTKSSEKSRYARGSGAKLAACDVTYKIEMLRPFTRECDGLLRLAATKDRRGHLHRDWQVQVRTGDGKLSYVFARGEAEGASKEEWPPARHKVYEYLASAPRTSSEIALATAYTAETVSRELNALLAEGYVRREGADQDGRVATWRRVK